MHTFSLVDVNDTQQAVEHDAELEEEEAQEECDDLRCNITEKFAKAISLELKIRKLDDEDKEEKDKLMGELQKVINILSQLNEVPVKSIGSYQPSIDGPILDSYAESLVKWFTKGVRRQCIDICNHAIMADRLKAKDSSTRALNSSQTDDDLRRQIQKRIELATMGWDDVQKTRHTRASATPNEIKMRENTSSLMQVYKRLRREVDCRNAYLRNTVRGLNAMDVDTQPVSLPINNAQIKLLAGQTARQQLLRLLDVVEKDCRETLSKSTTMLYSGVWEHITTPLAMASIASDILPSAKTYTNNKYLSTTYINTS